MGNTGIGDTALKLLQHLKSQAHFFVVFMILMIHCCSLKGVYEIIALYNACHLYICEIFLDINNFEKQSLKGIALPQVISSAQTAIIPEFAECWAVSNRFKNKNVRVSDCPPPMIEKSLSV